MLDKFRTVVRNLKVERVAKPVYTSLIPLLLRDKWSRLSVNPYSELEDMYEVIFVHIPKNAGNGFAQSVFGMDPKGHNFLSHYKSYDSHKYSKYFKFGLTRDVHSRFYSAFNYLSKGGFGVYDLEFRSKYLKNLSIDDFILKLSDDDVYRRDVMSWTHFIPQVEFLLIDGVCELDYVGSVEDISEAMEIVSRNLGIDFFDNKIVNSSGSKHGGDFFSSKSYDLICEFYKEDVDLIASMQQGL